MARVCAGHPTGGARRGRAIPPHTRSEREAICFTLTRGGQSSGSTSEFALPPLLGTGRRRCCIHRSRGDGCVSSTCSATPFADSQIRRRPSTAHSRGTGRAADRLLQPLRANSSPSLRWAAAAACRAPRRRRHSRLGAGRAADRPFTQAAVDRPTRRNRRKPRYAQVLSGTCPVDSSTAASCGPAWSPTAGSCTTWAPDEDWGAMKWMVATLVAGGLVAGLAVDSARRVGGEHADLRRPSR